MTSPDLPGMPENPTEKELMYLSLLDMSSRQYAEDPLFFSRVQIALAATVLASQITGIAMTRDGFAIAAQAACVALMMSSVSDEIITESVDHAKVAFGMLEFGLASRAVHSEHDEKGS